MLSHRVCFISQLGIAVTNLWFCNVSPPRDPSRSRLGLAMTCKPESTPRGFIESTRWSICFSCGFDSALVIASLCTLCKIQIYTRYLYRFSSCSPPLYPFPLRPLPLVSLIPPGSALLHCPSSMATIFDLWRFTFWSFHLGRPLSNVSSEILCVFAIRNETEKWK